MGRGVVTDRATCHQVASACGSKNAASTRVGAALMSRAWSNSGDAPAAAMRGSCYRSTLGRRAGRGERVAESGERVAGRGERVAGRGSRGAGRGARVAGSGAGGAGGGQPAAGGGAQDAESGTKG